MANRKKEDKKEEVVPSVPPEEMEPEPPLLGMLTKEQFERLLTRASQPRRKEPGQEADET